MATDFYIDRGTTNTLVYCSRRGLLVDEPSLISLHHSRGRVATFAVGASAKIMLGRTPGTLPPAG